MRKHFEKKTVVVLILSLLLASRYVEYGKRVKASETEQKVQIEGEGEIMMQKERAKQRQRHRRKVRQS